MSSSASVSVSNSHPSNAPKWADCSEYIQMLTTRRLFPVDSPDHSPLLWHFRVLSGHPSQEAGGAPALGTADADKVPRSHHITRSLCRHLMGNHCVLANLLKNLWDFYWLLIFLHFFFVRMSLSPSQSSSIKHYAATRRHQQTASLTLTCLTFGFQSPICSMFPTSSSYRLSGCCSSITSSLNTFPMSGNVLLRTLSPFAWGGGLNKNWNYSHIFFHIR